MPAEAVVTMVVSLGIVWGGFVFVLVTALRKERLKGRQ
ncbi:MAG: MetS family NSS transporter small subunit [Ignavibacteriales bacterium]|nr:MetS family NSS transporter small subunit [Ignavibacteriales bacterium]